MINPSEGAARVRRVLRAAGRLLLPVSCWACGTPVEGGGWAPLLCATCGDALPLWCAPVAVPRPLAAGMAWARFEGTARTLLVLLKYRGLLRAGWTLGRRMARAPQAGDLMAGADLVVPVPLHWRRRWRRGHNQALCLARGLLAAWPEASPHKALASGWRVPRRPSDRRAPRARRQRAPDTGSGCGPILSRALRRCRPTRPQVGLDRNERLANVYGAFSVRSSWRPVLDGATVLLVDDVVTTGSTAAAAARALCAAGAGEVRLYAAAWAEPPGARARPASSLGPDRQ